jgi:hypothetical protein
VICSEAEVYAFDGEGFTVAPEWMRDVVEGQWQRERERESAKQRVIVERFDLLCPTIRIPDPANPGQDLLRHEFAPRTVGERSIVAKIVKWSVLKPPVLQITSLLQPEPDGPPSLDTQPYLDPLLAGGRRSWLLALNLVFSALMAFFAHHRLSGFEAPASTRRFWTIATAILGAAAFLMFLFIERPRAYQRPAAIPPDQLPPLLISST